MSGPGKGGTGAPPSVVLLASVLLLAAAPAAPAQEVPDAPADGPRLVVGITVDQMRYDFLHRFRDHYGQDGFRRLLEGGFSFDHARFDYAPTFTGPGHASVYTGTTPAVHGIIENTWFLREEGRTTYVTDDPGVETVGSPTALGRMSPRWLLSTTIGDELRLHTGMRSRVVGLSLKDRGSILPAGHTGEAYWFDEETGDFITSTHYRDELPEWARAFNERGLVAEYLAGVWEPVLPEEAIGESRPENPPEAAFPGQVSPDFPHDLTAVAEVAGPETVAWTPFGDELLLELARAAIEGLSLGEGEAPDLLAISFSSPDHVGHRFGPASREIQDTYVRLDRELGRFLRYLDDRLGMENVLLFLTSDHGAAQVPGEMEALGIPAGSFVRPRADRALRSHLEATFGLDPVLAFRRFQVYLDREAIRAAGLSLPEVQAAAARFLPELEGIAGALTAEALTSGDFRDVIRGNVQRGFHPGRSGDVAYWLDPQWIEARSSGTTHGSPYSYDTRAPLLWYGWNVPAGRTTEPAFISDIAPTLAVFLDIPYPSGSTGNPLNHRMGRDR